VVEVGRDDALATVLREIGFAPRQVAVVIVSHLHYDHCGGLAQMSGSDVYAGAAELGFASAPSPEQQAAYWPGDWEAVAADRWKLIDQEHDVLGDGSVVIVPTPGHTPGHISLLVRLQRHTLLLAGDAAYDIGAIRQRRLPGYLWDAEAVASSWQRIEELEGSEGAGIILSHEILPGARIGPGEWYE
jgi:glyoxylase-like metal-dependent hydrolase (beta-lactamase superfamily II)